MCMRFQNNFDQFQWIISKKSFIKLFCVCTYMHVHVFDITLYTSKFVFVAYRRTVVTTGHVARQWSLYITSVKHRWNCNFLYDYVFIPCQFQN